METVDGVEVRPGELDDAQGAALLFDEALGPRYVPATELEHLAARPDAVWLIATVSGRVVGSATAEVLDEPGVSAMAARWAPEWDPEPPVVRLASLAVAPAWRRRGVGSALIAGRLGWAADAGARQVVAVSWDGPSATSRGPLVAAGFSVVAQRARYWEGVHHAAMPCVRCGARCRCSATLLVRRADDQLVP